MFTLYTLDYATHVYLDLILRKSLVMSGIQRSIVTIPFKLIQSTQLRGFKQIKWWLIIGILIYEILDFNRPVKPDQYLFRINPVLKKHFFIHY